MNFFRKTFIYYVLWKVYRTVNLFFDSHRNRRWRTFDLTRKVIVGEAERNGKILCLFAHYDARGALHASDVHHLESLRRDLNCDIAFCSTNIDLEKPQIIDVLKRLTFLTSVRENKGYDFGSWKTLLDMMGDRLLDYDYLLLTNNSVYGPLFPLTSVIETVKPSDNVMLGITESKEWEYHLQSYFLFLPRRVFSSDEFKKFWMRFRFLDVKKNIIYAYELGLSRTLLRAGVERRALYPTKSVAVGNPTHKLWLQLVLERKCPYVKRDILKNGTASGKDIEELRSWVAKNSQFDPQYISP